MDINEIASGNRVVLMCGVTGSGKTAYARRLHELGFVRLSVDEMIWDRYGNGFAEMPFAEQKLVFQSIGDAMIEEMCRLLDAGHKLVLDSTMCKRAKRDHIAEVCAGRGIVPLIVYLKASLPLLRQRLSGRKGSGPNDQIVDDGKLQSFYANFEVPQPDENFVEIIQD